MQHWTTTNGWEIHRVLSGRVNSYLVMKKDVVLLIDTGLKSAFNRLSKNIHSLTLNVENITNLLLTHTHFDHCGNAKAIQKISNCQIITSHHAKNSVNAGYTEIPKGTLVITKILSKVGKLLGKRKFGYTPFDPDVLIHEDCVLDGTDSEIKIITTAGHSADSISVLIDEEIAIVGDAMFGVLRNSIFPPFADDVNGMQKSWKKLLETNCKIFLPGHGKAIVKKLVEKQIPKHSNDKKGIQK